jgi:hypothetical protein
MEFPSCDCHHRPSINFEEGLFHVLHLDLKVLMGECFVERISLFKAFSLFPVVCPRVDEACRNGINMNLKLHLLPCLVTKLWLIEPL